MVVSEAAEPVDLAPAREVLEQMGPVSSTDIIPLLQRLQEAYGYLPRQVVLDVCEETGLPASRVFGVATFYAQFHLEPHGKHAVRVCRGTACHVRGGRKVLSGVEKVLGIRDGETTDDLLFSLETVACFGTCFLAPVLMVDGDYYGRVTTIKIKTILDQYK